MKVLTLFLHPADLMGSDWLLLLFVFGFIFLFILAIAIFVIYAISVRQEDRKKK
jgi:hypothetical protein